MKIKLVSIFFCLVPPWSLPAGQAQQIENIVKIEINKDWQFRQAGIQQWMHCEVPGSVHNDLLRVGQIGPPFYRMNEISMQWIDKIGWEYQTNIIPGKDILVKEKIELVFEGLDTYAEVFLNDRHILSTDNMFRAYMIDVKSDLRAGENTLRVLFKSPTLTGFEKLKEYGFQLAADNDQSQAGEMGEARVSPYVRKAPYHFGWDWGPRLVTSGIWRPVKLIAWDEAKIEDIWVKTLDINDVKSDIEITLTVETTSSGAKGIAIYIDDSLFKSEIWNLESGINKFNIPLSVGNPRLWWPNGMGEQNLYKVEVAIFNKGKIFDKKGAVIGLRMVELVQEPDPEGEGKGFFFRINGRPVFAKGANYIPNDVFLGQVSTEKYEFMVKSAADANMNMLRVWGGGIYENDIFYDLCDRHGIMVWQDFMFACAMYPGNDEFLDNVRIEAEQNVRRLRNHPSLVLWCGNNEIEVAWAHYEENRGWGWKQRYDAEQREIIWKAYDTLFHDILQKVVAKEDPDRSYWHSSPSAGLGKLASYESNSGDMHYWGVWHGQHPFSDFRKYRARFMSEYGFQSFPEFSTVKKYTKPEDHDIESDVMMSHQRSGIGNLRIKQYMEWDYQVPENFELFLYVGQLLQADAIRTAVESHRASMPYCMGSLYWQLNDVWPVASWSGIDYYGRWKALHYAVREVFKPAVLAVSDDEESVNIDIISDLSENKIVTMESVLVDFDGTVLWKQERTCEMLFQSVTRTFSISLESLLSDFDLSSIVLVTRLKDGDQIIDMDFHYFSKPKNLNLKDPNIEMQVFDEGDLYVVMLNTTSLAKNVYLTAEGFEGQFSENFFDLLPGEEYAVSFPKESSYKVFKDSLKLVHLQMTMQ